MGKKKHKKKRKDKKQKDNGIQSASTSSIRLGGASYPVYSWGLSNFLTPSDTPFTNYFNALSQALYPKPKTEPLTDKDVDAAAQAADQIVRKHKKG